MNTALHFSSKDQTWETPQAFFDELDQEFGFVLDVCALPETAKCAEFYTPEEDGLTKNWGVDSVPGPCWMNPPYGREIKHWIAKAAKEARMGAVVVALIPSRTDTAYWHDHIWDAENNRPHPWVREVRFVRGRLKFGNAKNAAPFPSAVVVFDAQGDLWRWR